MTQPKRDWTAAIEKRDREGCRVCGDDSSVFNGPVQAAHIIGREHDKERPYLSLIADVTPPWKPYMVVPERIVPLCLKHHQMYDAHELDLLGYLTAEEEAQATLDAGSLESARRRLCPSEYRPKPVYECSRCRAPKGAHALGESCNQNCGGKVVLATREEASLSEGWQVRAGEWFPSG